MLATVTTSVRCHFTTKSHICERHLYFISKIDYGFKIKNFYSIERGELYMYVLHFKVSVYSAKCFFLLKKQIFFFVLVLRAG